MKRIDKIFANDKQNVEIQALKKAMKGTKQKRMYQRYKVVYHHLKGYSNQAIQKTWFQKGKQRIIPTYGKH